MHPIERLRWIARLEGESDSTVAGEAAWLLGELSTTEPPAVLTASRRLVLRRPACGPLWWACARILESAGSDDVLDIAQQIALELAADTVPAKLALSLKKEIPSGEALLVTSPSDTISRGLGPPGRYSIRLLASYRDLRYEMSQFRGADVTGYELDEAEEAAEGCSVVLVEPGFTGPDRLYLGVGAAMAVRSARQRGIPCWAVLAAGRSLSEPLAKVASQLARDEVAPFEPDLFARAVDQTGLTSLSEALGQVSCPPALELAHLLG